jgi:hypothetical protein
MDALARGIREHRAILFVGAGVSADLGLPSWRGLIAAVIERILDHLGRGGESLDPLDPAHPSRGPPQGELSL